MQKLLGLMFLVVLTQFSCTTSSSQRPEPPNNKPPETSKINSENSRPENNNMSKPKGAAEKFDDNPEPYVDMVYSSDLTSIAYGKEFGPIGTGDTLAYKRETILPQNIEKLRSFTEINPAAIDKLIERNKTTEKLKGDYDVKHSIFRVDKKSSDANLLPLLNRERKDIKCLIGFSRIGYNEDFTQSLTYVEYYDLTKTLRKKYILINWDYSQGGSMVKDTKWFPAE